jgi:pimeloyl-ACP methyl ester carboxylesterase
MSAVPASPEVAVSPELKAPLGGDLEICYQTFGDPGDDPLLLVMGLGGPMTWWDEDFCRLLASRGFFVIRYDNRDTGRSTKCEGRVTRRDVVRTFTGLSRKAPYSLSDMAGDAIGLLDHLGIDQAHVAGVSMGGMIVQTLAVEHQSRLRSMVSIMSTTGRRSVGWQDPRLFPTLLGPRLADRESYIEGSAKMWKMIGSPAFPTTVESQREKAATTFDRGLNPSGVLRQMAAILTQPNRTMALRGVTIPTAVVHGTADRMVHVTGGRATAAAIPGAELVTIKGMGHDVPEQLFGTLADIFRRTADRA